MDDRHDNRLREVPQAFHGATEIALPSGLGGGAVYRAKVFKSGNSLALRLPKALGLEAGMEMELTTEAGGTYHLSRVEPAKQKLDISGFWGKCPGIKLAPREDFEERPSTIAAREAARKAAGLA